MKKQLFILGAASMAAILAVPVSGAQPTPARADRVREAINELEADINRADRNDAISRREAADLRARVANLRSDFQMRNADGLRKQEVRDLESRVDRIRGRLRDEKHDSNNHVN